TTLFSVACTAATSPPFFPSPPIPKFKELTPLTVPNPATDGDIPANVLTYQLVSPPSGASINASGVISWTPSEIQGPGTATFTTIVTDNGTPPLSATNSFAVTVNDVNTAPVLPAQANRTINEDRTLDVVNTP